MCVRASLTVGAALLVTAKDGRAEPHERGSVFAHGNTGLILGEIAEPPKSAGIDRATFKALVATELRHVQHVLPGHHRGVVVSTAITSATAEPTSFTVSAVLRDAKSGNMLAVAWGRARSEGATTNAARREVLGAAVRDVLRQIPQALAG